VLFSQWQNCLLEVEIAKAGAGEAALADAYPIRKACKRGKPDEAEYQPGLYVCEGHNGRLGYRTSGIGMGGSCLLWRDCQIIITKQTLQHGLAISFSFCNHPSSGHKDGMLHQTLLDLTVLSTTQWMNVCSSLWALTHVVSKVQNHSIVQGNSDRTVESQYAEFSKVSFILARPCHQLHR
jgi:hypothetical protein